MLEQHRRIVITSKHVNLVAWLMQTYPDAAARASYDPMARPSSITPGTAVIGTWPTQIVAAADAYYSVEFRTRPRQADLSPAEMIAHGAYLKRWHLLSDDQVQAIKDDAVEDYIHGTLPAA